jgi:ABC-type nickel/cobalt efflux system permease component RcnA
MRFSEAFLLLITAFELQGHPMGNFSVNHYARFEVTANGVELTYVLDLAELPTFDLLRSWQLERNGDRRLLEAKAREQANEWLANLQIQVDRKPVRPRLERADLVIADGAGDLPVLRISSKAKIRLAGGALDYEDLNFPNRAGWKEIVIVAGSGATLLHASQSDQDLSHALTQYPPDPTVAPPQDLRAELQWSVDRPAHRETVIAPIPQPNQAPAGINPAPAAAPAGTAVRGDFLSGLLHQRELTPWMMFLGLAAAFALGAAHALTPGHGKTIVAAYLVGSRGTLKHAAFLGLMVTFTHTITVFALGLATLFLFRFVMPEKIAQILGVISGLSIVAVGLWMVRKRLAAAKHTHHHHHHHGPHDHHHHRHSHVPAEISWPGLIALGASGGLVPCESALVLLLGAIAIGRVALGLLLLLAFSAGLAIVLMTIGVLVLYAKNLLPESHRTGSNPVFRWVPMVSAALVTVLGLIVTGVSLGWIPAKWALS